MSNPTIISLIERYSSSSLTPEEEIILTEWLKQVSATEFHETLDQCAIVPESVRNYPVMSPAFAQRLERDLDGLTATPVRSLYWRRWTAAAAVLLLLATACYFYLNHPGKAKTLMDTSPPPVIANDVLPGGDGAILTLADGRQIVLDSVANGKLATDGNAAITKTGKGQLAYITAASGKLQATSQIAYNTVTTPRGRKVSLTLADGTQVWLNAASSIRFPTTFSGKDRTVEINGEAYFEVARNAIQPFIVKKGGSDFSIEVLGTRFNVNAYDNDAGILTTLLDGSVRVSKAGVNKLVKPGQMAVAEGSGISFAAEVNLDAVMAWKNGLFYFDHSDIGTVMQQIARWYDLDIEYKGEFHRHFGGTISRDVNVSKVLKMLEMTGAVKFAVEGHKVTAIAP